MMCASECMARMRLLVHVPSKSNGFSSTRSSLPAAKSLKGVLCRGGFDFSAPVKARPDVKQGENGAVIKMKNPVFQ